MKRFVAWLLPPWRRRRRRYPATRQFTPPSGLCDPCRDLLSKRPATVLRAEGYRAQARGRVAPHE